MHPRGIRRFALLYCLLVSCYGFAASGGEESDDLDVSTLETLSRAIVYVNSFGSFRAEGKEGHYRVILLDVEDEHPHSEIYLQWILQGEGDGGDGRVISSRGISEINNTGVYKLSVPKISSEQGGNVIDVMTVNQYTQTVKNLQIRPGEVNKYQLHYAPQTRSDNVDKVVGKIPLSLDYYSRPSF